jgi:hypothetical protein
VDEVTGTVAINGERVVTTPQHPFLTVERGWVEAEDLVSGDHVPSATGDAGVIGSISWDGGPATMYDLTVGTVHTFAVGRGGWVVHNVGPCVSLIGSDPRLVREAEKAGRSLQTEIDALTLQLQLGNRNPGVGTRSIVGLPGILEARTRNGARVYFRYSGDGVEILGKSTKANQTRVISLLVDIYGY